MSRYIEFSLLGPIAQYRVQFLRSHPSGLRNVIPNAVSELYDVDGENNIVIIIVIMVYPLSNIPCWC